MTSYHVEFSAQPPSPIEKGHSNSPFLPASPPRSGKGFYPFLTLELPVGPWKGYSDHPAHTSSPSPNQGKGCINSTHPLGSPQFSRDPFSGLTCSPGISSETGMLGSLPEPVPSQPPPPLSPPPQPPLRLARCSFEPCLPLGRQSYREPIHLGSPPPSPCFHRFRFMESPPYHPQSPYCSLMSPPRTRWPCPRSPYIDQNTYLCYSVQYPSALVTYPVTGPMISPYLAHRPMEYRPIISPPPSPRVLEISQISPLYPTWSSGRSYNDSLSSASSPPTGQLYLGRFKPPDSCKPQPQLDPPLEKNYCGSLFPQANTPGCPRSPQEDSHHYSHLPPEAHVSTPGSPYCGNPLPAGMIDSSCSPQSQASRKPCLESVFSWETNGNSYLVSGTPISGSPCSQEPPLPLSAQYPNSAFSFPSPLGNQFISPPQSPPRRSYNEPSLLTPVCPQVKSTRSPELKQPYVPYSPAQDTPFDQPKAPKDSASPPLPSHPLGLSDPCSITTCSNSCPQTLPQGTVLPTPVPRTLKTVNPTSLPPCLPCDPLLPNVCVQSHPHGPPLGAPCNTHMYSVVPSTPNPCPLSGSTGPPQCYNQPMVTPCGTYGSPRGPPQPPRQPVGPPCSTHIYSYIPLRTPFDPQSLPIAPRPCGHPDTTPCGLHVYSVAPQGSRKEPPRIPYSSPLLSPTSSGCSSNIPSCSSTVLISECQSSDNQSKNIHQSRSRSQCETHSHPSRSRSKSKCCHLSRNPSQTNTSHQSLNEDQSENLQLGIFQRQSESPQYRKSQGPNKSSLHNKSLSQNKSSHQLKRQCKNKSSPQGRNRSKSPQRKEK
ncbi:sperm head and tail associated protein-like [Eptesicus fuscus]|uniref:sperm head and tail associated protein-like n=1 Tax=Eptesicus fuscus TaxID=29078 RepID=UPI002403B936|nr:sperm head and tail associated protein-like [Eptesicus fuscus]